MTGRAGAAIAVIAVCGWTSLACGRGEEPVPALNPQPAAAAPATGAPVPHGDHNPHYGGLVLMNGDEHFEVVFGRDGSARVYFSDAVRNELPAATASGVTITLTRPGQPPEAIPMHIDDSGESWVGRGHPVTDPATTVRIAYTSHSKPYFIDVPFPEKR